MKPIPENTRIVINSLYSQKEIFLRELISNASDAINKRKFDIITSGNAADTFEGKINIAVDKKIKSLRYQITASAFRPMKWLKPLAPLRAQVQRPFIESTKTSENTKEVNDQLIGQFGVGFYSAFMVAEKVEVLSKNMVKNPPVNGRVMDKAVTALPMPNALKQAPLSFFTCAKKPRNIWNKSASHI